MWNLCWEYLSQWFTYESVWLEIYSQDGCLQKVVWNPAVFINQLLQNLLNVPTSEVCYYWAYAYVQWIKKNIMFLLVFSARSGWRISWSADVSVRERRLLVYVLHTTLTYWNITYFSFRCLCKTTCIIISLLHWQGDASLCFWELYSR